jgi:hypothetical protein
MIERRLAEPWARAGFPWAVLDTRELLLIGADLVSGHIPSTRAMTMLAM